MGYSMAEDNLKATIDAVLAETMKHIENGEPLKIAFTYKRGDLTAEMTNEDGDEHWRLIVWNETDKPAAVCLYEEGWDGEGGMSLYCQDDATGIYESQDVLSKKWAWVGDLLDATARLIEKVKKEQ